MAEVVLFHHIQGRTPGVEILADELREAGHSVHVPDLFDGRTFDEFNDGVRFADELGFGTVLERGVRAVDELPRRLAYVGLSLGVMPAQKLAQTRPGALGAVFVGSCVPPTEFGDGWPAELPVQVHGMDADPIFIGEGDLDAAREVVAQARDGELFLYPGDRHLFFDSSLPAYDPDASALLTRRVLEFLSTHVAR